MTESDKPQHGPDLYKVHKKQLPIKEIRRRRAARAKLHAALEDPYSAQEVWGDGYYDLTEWDLNDDS